MTECERIIEQGILPKSFFEEDTICDYFVTKKQKKIWAVEIDLLVKFDEICRKHNLRYSLAGGSLLGAIRHNGFIPWDDDVDVFMPRADYEQLKEYKEEFEEPYFLQYPGNDNGYYFSYAKLRNSNTTSISWAFRYEDFNQGCFLDIFPLDNYQPIDIETNISRIKNLIAESSALMRRSNTFPDTNDKEKLAKFPMIRDGNTLFHELDSVLRQYESKPSEKYIVWSFVGYDYRRLTFNKRLFDELTEVDYYGHKVFIPLNYDEVLKISFGDYMTFPPIEQRETRHFNNIFDPDIPYKEYIAQLREKDEETLQLQKWL